MTTRRRRNVARFLALALAAGSAMLLGSAGSAGADGPPAQLTAKGWWWEAQADQLPAPLPAPPNVAPGQLYVQGDPTGKSGSAYAAVRYTVDASHTATSLTLTVGDNGDSGGASAVVLACRTGSAWTAAEAGKWSTAPKVDNAACVNGQRASDGKSWTFAVKTLQVGPTVDVAIVPGVDPNTTTTSTFALSFNAPSDDSLASDAGSPPPVTAPPPTAAIGNDAGATAPASSGGGTFHPAAPAPIATGLPAEKVGQTATSPANQAASQANLDQAIASSTPAKDRNKTPGYLVLALAAAIGLYAWRQDNLMAMNGGALPGAADEPGGLGRFSRPRSGTPPALT